MWYWEILSDTLKDILLVNETLTGTATLDQSGSGSNGNKGITSHFLELYSHY